MMKITINKSAILPILARAAGVAGAKTHFSITGHILVRAEGGAEAVTIEANNLETAIQSQCPAQVEAPGEAALEASSLLQIVKAWPGETITIAESKPRWFSISADGRVQYHLGGLAPEEFANIVTAETNAVQIPPAALAREISRAAVISQPTDDNRAHVAGFRIRLKTVEEEKEGEGEEKETIAHRIIDVDSTDGARMSRGSLDVETTTKDFSAIVPKKAARSLMDFLETTPAGEPVQIRASRDYISATAGTETISVRILEGEFPRMGELLSQTRNGGFVHDGARLAASVSRMAIMTNEKYKGQIWNLSPGQLKITATNPDMGESEETILVEFDGPGDGWELAWDSRYILEAIKCTGGAVNFDFCGSYNALHVHSEPGGAYRNVVMPMKI